MTPTVLIANRGEVAVRVIRAAKALGLRTVAVFSEDDCGAMHHRLADEAVELAGVGPVAYLDPQALVVAAVASRSTHLHPGWGFLSEQPELARLCTQADVRFVGPRAETLEVLGDKLAARGLASRLDVPMVPSSEGPATLTDAQRLLDQAGPGRGIMLKAVAGGGGRGIRVARTHDELPGLFRACAAEAEAAFGDPRVFVEAYVPRCRHIEVQVIGDDDGDIAVLGDRDCSIQRRYQKIVEVAPAPHLPAAVRAGLWQAARAIASDVRLTGVGTFEFLVEVGGGDWWFMEANPRLQVEHTITEEVFGLDLVQAQLRIAAGSTLAELGITDVPHIVEAAAIQLRLNAERVTARGTFPSAGDVTRLQLPVGDGVRVDTGIAEGEAISPRFDSLLAKIIAHTTTGGLPEAVELARAAVKGTVVAGVDTNLALLSELLEDPRLAAGQLSTAFMDLHRATEDPVDDHDVPPADGAATIVTAETAGVVTRIDVNVGDRVRQGADLVHVEAMKMQNVALSPRAGRVSRILVAEGDECRAGTELIELEPVDVDHTDDDSDQPALVPVAPESPQYQEVMVRHELVHDAARPAAVAKRRQLGQRTTRENLADLFEPGSFLETGPLVVASRLWKDTEAELAQRTPADGVVTGVGNVKPDDDTAGEGARCAAIAYDATVMGGTQGHNGTEKVERLIELATRSQLPVFLIADGGGGRPGDAAPGTFAPPVRAFRELSRLSGTVPMVGMVTGPCFAGNAAMLGACDITIATPGASVGMAGPVVVEAARLGTYSPREIGPVDQLHKVGVIDILAEDEAAAVAEARRSLGYLTGQVTGWQTHDQELLRTVLPHDRLRAYDVRRVIELIADVGSVQELKKEFGATMVTAFGRVEGRPYGFVANNPAHGAGAIDGPGARKATRFVAMCNAFDVPVVFLCDTPGFAAGPEAEATGQLRDLSDFLIAGGQLAVPFMTIILRKGYGLGAVAMCGGSYRAPWANIAWPGAEIGGMAPEAAVRLDSASELAAIADDGQRAAEFDLRVEAAREATSALRAAARFRVDDAVDPAQSRTWITQVLGG